MTEYIVNVQAQFLPISTLVHPIYNKNLECGPLFIIFNYPSVCPKLRQKLWNLMLDEDKKIPSLLVSSNFIYLPLRPFVTD